MSAYHFHNESQIIKTEFARRAVITSADSLPLFCWTFWIAASPLRRWESSHTFSLDIRMSSYLVGASIIFLLGFLWIPNPKWGDEMVTSVWSTARVSEAIWFFTGDISRLKHYFHYESHIDKPRNWWQTTLESGRTVRTFSLDILIHGLNQEYIQTENVKAHLGAHSSPPQL